MARIPTARISINATPKDVFHVLKNFKNYQQWNPWLIIDGESVEGKVIQIKPRRLTIWTSHRYQVEAVIASERIIWEEISWLGFITTTRREQMIYTKADGSTVYSTSLYLCGIISHLASYFYGKQICRGLNAEALALKQFCEAKYPLNGSKVSTLKSVSSRINTPSA